MSQQFGHNNPVIQFMVHHPYLHPFERKFPYCYCPFFQPCDIVGQTKPKIQHNDIAHMQAQTPKPAEKARKKIKPKLQFPTTTSSEKKIKTKLISKKYKVKYFDPNNCPIITSNQIAPTVHQQQVSRQMSNIKDELIPEPCNQAFIIYKNAKINQTINDIMKKYMKQEQGVQPFQIQESSGQLSQSSNKQ